MQTTSSLHARIIGDVEELELLGEPWRELAHACHCPAALPAWQLAWWRHLAPEGSTLKAVAVSDESGLAGLAPLFVSPGLISAYRFIGGELTRRMKPLARPGGEAEVMRAIAAALDRSLPRPDLVELDGVDADASWIRHLTAAWPGSLRPWRYVTMTHPGPAIETAGLDFDAWFSSRSAHARRNARRARKKADELGVSMTLHVSKPGVERALREYRRLHTARLAGRGGSSLGEPEFEMIEQAARDLVPSGEMRVYSLESEDDTIAVAIALVAGGEVLLFSSGFDDSYAAISPIYLMVVELVEEAFRNGARRIDFGGGTERHKHVFANSDAPISWGGLAIRSLRYPLTRVRLAPKRIQWHKHRLAHRLLTQEQIDRIRRTPKAGSALR